MTVLIVEDETVANRNLKAMLKALASDICVVGAVESVLQTVRWLSRNPEPDLIFMDIHLSDGSSFNIFSAVTIEAPIIFTTAYDTYAIDAFKVNSIDYLLKPIQEKDVLQALNKFRKLNQHEKQNLEPAIARLISNGYFPPKILVPMNDRLLPINLEDIACFYTADEHTRVILRNGKSFPYSKSLENINGLLNPFEFYRVNRQFIVSKNAITDISIWFDNRLLLKLSVEVPEKVYVSKNKASEFKRWMIS
jgi:two-component system, LytTR family, response regulator LytT